MTVRQHDHGTRSTGAAPRTRTRHPYLVVAVVLVAAFVQMIDVSIINVAIPSVQSDLNATASDVQWVVAGYQLAFACVLIVSGRLGDTMGSRSVFLLGMTIFTAASAACGAAGSPAVLILARIVQGLGSGLMYPQAYSVVQLYVPPDKRQRALGMVAACLALATILGPLIGGLLIDWDVMGLGWRAIFLVNVPIGLAAIAGALRLLDNTAPADAERPDLPGIPLVMAGTFLLLYPLLQGRELGWPWWLYGMLALAAVLLAGFVLWERSVERRGRAPLVYPALFRDRGFSVGLTVILVFFAGLPVYALTLTLYLQVGFGRSALAAGVATLPFALGTVVASGMSERVSNRLGRTALSVPGLVMAAGMGALAWRVHSVDTELSAWSLAPMLFLVGVGLGLFAPVAVDRVLDGVHSRHVGSASGALSTAQQIGGAFGVAVIGLLFFTQVTGNANDAAAAAVARSRPALVAAGVPERAVDPLADGFARCFRARLDDANGKTPAACRQAQGGAGGAVAAELAGKAVPRALALDYGRSLWRTLLVEAGVYLLAALLALALPSRRSEERTPVSGHKTVAHA